MSGYIQQMRKLVGHKTILQCGASVIVENEKGEILFQLRNDNNYWGYAGGSVELDEVVEEAAKRELFEETGLIADKLELFGIFSGEDMHYTYPNGDEVSNVDIVFLCKSYSGTLKCDYDEGRELKFFSIDHMPENISPPIVKVINHYINSRKNGTNEIKEDLLSLIQTRRSIRKFKDKLVETSKLDILLKAALMAPSSRGKKSCEMVVITDKAMLCKLSECRAQSSKFLAQAPLGIVIIADKENSDVWTEDASITATFIQLMAHSQALGSCWIQVRQRMTEGNISVDAYIKECLAIPEQYAVECILAIGYADEKKTAHDIEQLSYNKIHFNQF
jgi:8-oxo-dGTP pyrophosphatase MutT (NUDIX family)/nitroreductase